MISTHRLEWAFARVRNFGLTRYCPCCKSHLRQFVPYPHPPRPGRRTRREARCPICGSLERHRLIVQYLEERTDFWNSAPKRVLHVAPERQIARIIRRATGVRYVSTDIESPRAMVKADLMRLGFADNSFDIIYCSHVLEHVPDDGQAMRELRRVLRSDGWAILQVPVVRDRTYEDASITSEEGRLAAFGQHDHVRAYGPDYADRLRAAGFAVKVDNYLRDLSEATRMKLGLSEYNEDVHFCRRA